MAEEGVLLWLLSDIFQNSRAFHVLKGYLVLHPFLFFIRYLQSHCDDGKMGV